jgi:bifunctional UDP-N-acetylglucosamine pyrophosphorylase / glucosamine-1-phosphate N-acetyltransferase
MKNQYVILAAGKGTRMGNPRTPKVLVMLKNKPLILYTLEQIDKINRLVKPVIVVGFGAEKVKAILGNGYVYALQEEQLGTAHALMAAKRKIRAENILVVYGDMPLIKSESLSQLIKTHLHAGAKISMLTAQVENFRGIYSSLEHYGRILRDAFHNIVGIVEYKDASETQKKIKEINPGIYMFSTKWLWEHIKNIENKNAQKEFYLTDIVQIALLQGETVRSLPVHPEEILGINSPEDLKRAEKIVS